LRREAETGLAWLLRAASDPKRKLVWYIFELLLLTQSGRLLKSRPIHFWISLPRLLKVNA
jgi:hypothetical protein